MFGKILLAVDHSATAERAISAAQELATLSDGEVWVLHLREKEVLGRGAFVMLESEAEAQEIVEHAVKELHDSGVKAHYEVQNTLHGQAGPAIVDAASAHDAGVIVMGSRGRSDLAGLFLGSTAHKVIHLSDRPVLVVR
jgi:nucleotide-binding universal stress UspA family protein